MTIKWCIFLPLWSFSHGKKSACLKCQLAKSRKFKMDHQDHQIIPSSIIFHSHRVSPLHFFLWISMDIYGKLLEGPSFLTCIRRSWSFIRGTGMVQSWKWPQFSNPEGPYEMSCFLVFFGRSIIIHNRFLLASFCATELYTTRLLIYK